MKVDHNDNAKPDKSSKQQKIDLVISMLEALGAYLAKYGGFDISALINDVLMTPQNATETSSDK